MTVRHADLKIESVSSGMFPALRGMKTLFSRMCVSTGHKPPIRASMRPRLETLEDRTVVSSFTGLLNTTGGQNNTHANGVSQDGSVVVGGVVNGPAVRWE